MIFVFQRSWLLQSYETSTSVYVASLPDPPQDEGERMPVLLENNLHLHLIKMVAGNIGQRRL